MYFPFKFYLIKFYRSTLIFLGLDLEMSNLRIRGLENVSKKSKKNNFFRKCFDCSKKIQLRS